jgi:hypothetical protein
VTIAVRETDMVSLLMSVGELPLRQTRCLVPGAWCLVAAGG